MTLSSSILGENKSDAEDAQRKVARACRGAGYFEVVVFALSSACSMPIILARVKLAFGSPASAFVIIPCSHAHSRATFSSSWEEGLEGVFHLISSPESASARDASLDESSIR